MRSFELLNNRFQVLNGSSFHMTVADRVTVTGNNVTELSDATFFGTDALSHTPKIKLLSG